MFAGSFLFFSVGLSRLYFTRPAALYSPSAARCLSSVWSASRLPDCRISALSGRSQLLSCLSASVSPRLLYFLLFVCFISLLPSSSYLLLSTFYLLCDLSVVYSLFIFLHTVPVLGPPLFPFLSPSPRDKEPRWHDGFQSGREQFAPGPRRLWIVLDKQVRWSCRVRREISWQEAIRGAKAWPPRDKCISFSQGGGDTGWGRGE